MTHGWVVHQTLTTDPEAILAIGVLTDTHIPDRCPQLPPAILSIFKTAGVSTILHAGDISIPAVITQLETIAPVYAVRGNRDWWLSKQLPMAISFRIGAMEVGLAHGHGGMLHYLQDKLVYLAQGLHIPRYQKSLLKLFPNARVIVYGHTHYPDQSWIDGHLFFNPGAGGSAALRGIHPAIGLLHLGPGMEVKSEIIPID